MRNYFPTGPATEYFRPPRNQRWQNRQPDVYRCAEVSGCSDLSAPALVGSPHHWSVHVLPVAAARTFRSRRTSTHAAHDSRQCRHCTEDPQTTGNHNSSFSKWAQLHQYNINNNMTTLESCIIRDEYIELKHVYVYQYIDGNIVLVFKGR